MTFPFLDSNFLWQAEDSLLLVAEPFNHKLAVLFQIYTYMKHVFIVFYTCRTLKTLDSAHSGIEAWGTVITLIVI